MKNRFGYTFPHPDDPSDFLGVSREALVLFDRVCLPFRKGHIDGLIQESVGQSESSLVEKLSTRFISVEDWYPGGIFGIFVTFNPEALESMLDPEKWSDRNKFQEFREHSAFLERMDFFRDEALRRGEK